MPPNPRLELNRAVPDGASRCLQSVTTTIQGWFYRFQWYQPDEGGILRYDNAHDDDDLGWHHRHVGFGEDTEIVFHNIVAHVARFLQDMASRIEGVPKIESDTDSDSDNHD